MASRSRTRSSATASPSRTTRTDCGRADLPFAGVRRIALLPLLLLAGCGADAPPTAATRPPVATPDFAQVTSQVPTRPEGRYLTARVKRAVWLRSAPDGRKLKKLGRNTEFGSKHRSEERRVGKVCRRGRSLEQSQ